MREIIFKGFRECESGTEKIQINGIARTGNWIQGKSVINAVRPFNECGYVFIGGRGNMFTAVFDDAERNEISGIKGAKLSKVIPETVGQFTGLCDINDKQGFEYDIVKRGKSTGVIRFGDGRFYIDWGENPESWSDTLYIHLKDSKVVGTIFDVKESTND